jgi:hypothetical protein
MSMLGWENRSWRPGCQKEREMGYRTEMGTAYRSGNRWGQQQSGSL